MPFLELKKQLATEIAGHFNANHFSPGVIAPESLMNEMGIPPNPQLGHVAFACFKLAKRLNTSAGEIAKGLCLTLNQKGLIAEPAGPYANVRWPTHLLFEITIGRALGEGTKYGSQSPVSSPISSPLSSQSTPATSKVPRVVIEYCSPNIAKRLGFQHIRSTLIGNTLANIYQSQGFQVERTNFVGDWGSQFARLLAAFSLWGDRQKLVDAKVAMPHLMEVYVRFHKECDEDPSLLDRANSWLKRLEEHDVTATETWSSIRRISLEAMLHTLGRLGVTFDHTEGESAYIGAMESTLAIIKDKAAAKLSEGAWIVELDGISTPALIQKRDGTTLYLTRDIAAAIDRHNRFDFDQMIYVVSDQQRLHFQQLFATLQKMGLTWSSNLHHVGFGTVLFGDVKMSTRQGHVILLDELLDEAHALALKECTAKNPDLPDKETVAEMVGVGAVIFGQLSAHRTRDITFDWKNVLALDGETGPYVQYSLVRCRSLLAKAGEIPDYHDFVESIRSAPQEPFAPEEDALILQIARFRSELDRARRENEPFYVTSYLIDLAKAFNRFYFKLPVIQCASPTTRGVRILLVKATGITLENGLRILNISCPSQM